MRDLRPRVGPSIEVGPPPGNEPTRQSHGLWARTWTPSGRRRRRQLNDCSRTRRKYPSDPNRTLDRQDCPPKCSHRRVQPRLRYRRNQPLHELQHRPHQVRGALAPRCLEIDLHLPRSAALHPFDGQNSPGDVAAQRLGRPCIAPGTRMNARETSTLIRRRERRIQQKRFDVGRAIWARVERN
jgi:hypothetical protein